MMRRLVFALVLSLAASPVLAADFVSAWVKQLTLDGYEEMTISRTWLGRTRIVAEKGDIRREIIFNSRTGEVLRDYSQSEDGRLKLPLGFEVELGDDDDHSDGGSSGDGDDGDGDDGGGDDKEDDSEDSPDGGEQDEDDERDENDDDKGDDKGGEDDDEGEDD